MNKSKEGQALVDALEPIVTKLIDDNFENSKEKIVIQISPLIGDAIREQIKSKKDDIIEALYPILGSMISKFVSKSLEEALNSINDQIQAGLSFKSLKRKIEAKRKGVTETQLLLEENSNSDIGAVLLIHKETGIILCEVHNPNEMLIEPEMIASMMTAINSFINDWIEKNESSNQVGEIDYGASKIVVENAGFAYLAVIVHGATYNRTLKKIRNTLETIISSHADEIREFNGNFSDFPSAPISEKMSTLISENQNTQNQKRKLHPLVWFIPLMLLFTLSWNIYQSNIQANLETKIQKTLYENPKLTAYRIQINLEEGVVDMNGHVPFLFHKELAEKSIKQIKGIESIKNNLIILPTLDDPMQISSNISYLLNGLNTDKGINITYEYNYPNYTIFGSTWDTHRKNKVLQALKSLNITMSLTDKIVISPPDIKTILFFNKGTYLLNEIQKNELLELSKLLNTLDKDTIVSVKGFSDDQGTTEIQHYFAKMRAESIASVLKDTFLVKQHITISTDDDISLYLDVESNADKQRCSVITLQMQEK